MHGHEKSLWGVISLFSNMVFRSHCQKLVLLVVFDKDAPLKQITVVFAHRFATLHFGSGRGIDFSRFNEVTELLGDDDSKRNSRLILLVSPEFSAVRLDLLFSNFGLLELDNWSSLRMRSCSLRGSAKCFCYRKRYPQDGYDSSGF